MTKFRFNSSQRFYYIKSTNFLFYKPRDRLSDPDFSASESENQGLIAIKVFFIRHWSSYLDVYELQPWKMRNFRAILKGQFGDCLYIQISCHIQNADYNLRLQPSLHKSFSWRLFGPLWGNLLHANHRLKTNQSSWVSNSTKLITSGIDGCHSKI